MFRDVSCWKVMLSLVGECRNRKKKGFRDVDLFWEEGVAVEGKKKGK